MIGVDPKDLAIADMKRTLAKLERTLRAFGEQELADEFIKMADEAKESINFAVILEHAL